jgi:predicted nucleotidyltransferase component of viral defense system
MEHILSIMMKQHPIKNDAQLLHALKEAIQEIALFALSKTDFFDHASFYGGSALRIFHGLNRFSEDLDFSLDSTDLQFDFGSYCSALETTFRSLGLSFQIQTKQKTTESFIRSAFLKGNTLEHVLMVEPLLDVAKQIQTSARIQIKLEIDVAPPLGATTEYRYGLSPQPYRIRLYDAGSLMAGKLHAVLCRAWKHRIKGRDLYDYLFFLKQGTKVNLPHLKMRLVETKRWSEEASFSLEDLKKLLHERFQAMDFELAKADVRNFIDDPKELELWSTDFFQSLTDHLLKN